MRGVVGNIFSRRVNTTVLFAVHDISVPRIPRPLINAFLAICIDIVYMHSTLSTVRTRAAECMELASTTIDCITTPARIAFESMLGSLLGLDKVLLSIMTSHSPTPSVITTIVRHHLLLLWFFKSPLLSLLALIL